MKNRVYAFLDDFFSWAHIFVEHMTLMEQEGILKTLDCMKVNVITKNDVRAEAFHRMCEVFPVKMEINFIESRYNNDFEMLVDWSQLQGDHAKPVSETPTLIRMYNDAQTEDMNILYLNSKSISSVANNLIKHRQPSKYKNRHLWRKFMNWGTINNWKTCVEALETHDIAGANYRSSPPHYSGGFWWATAKHIRSLPHPEDNQWWIELKRNHEDPWIQNMANRYRDEFWPCCRPGTKAFNFASNNGYYVENDI